MYILYFDVSHAMVIQIRRCGKSLSANRTLVRFLPTVDPPVRVE